MAGFSPNLRPVLELHRPVIRHKTSRCLGIQELLLGGFVVAELPLQVCHGRLACFSAIGCRKRSLMSGVKARLECRQPGWQKLVVFLHLGDNEVSDLVGQVIGRSENTYVRVAHILRPADQPCDGGLDLLQQIPLLVLEDSNVEEQ